MLKINLTYTLIIANGEIKDDVEYINDQGYKTKIKFKGNQKEYTYDKRNIIKLTNPKIYKQDDEYYRKNLFYTDKYLLSGSNCIIDFGNGYKRFLWRNGTFTTYNNLTIKDNILEDKSVNKIISYFKGVIPRLKNDKDNILDFLIEQYGNLQQVQPDSFLSNYLFKRNINYGVDLLKGKDIFPFDFNLSQKNALENIYKSNISVIEGPPGTGKTQTILNIIANIAIMQDKTVAVVSGNNSATANVKEKLDKYGYGFFVATLGNNDNKIDFFSNQPNINVFKLQEKIKGNYDNKLDEILKLMEISNEKVKIEQLLDNYKLEKEHFDIFLEKQDFEGISKLGFYKMSADKIVEFLAENSYINKLGKKNNILYKIKILFKYGFTNFKALKNNEINIILFLQKKYYEERIKEISDQISDLSIQLENKTFNELLINYSKYSKYRFEEKLNKKFNNFLKEDNINFSKLNYKKNFDKFLNRYPVILSTTHSIISSLRPGYLLDYIIIDEASQVDLLTACLAFSCAKNIILVGDDKQLTHIVSDKYLFNNDDIDKEFNYNINILKSIDLIYGNKIPKVILKEHYRCHPKIINFCNLKYYDNQLILHTRNKIENSKPLKLLRTTEGNHSRNITGEGLDKGKYNKRELEEISELLKNEQYFKKYSSNNIGIITPYRKQVSKAKEIIGEDIQIDTIHKFQGREKDAILLTTVISDNKDGYIGLKFVDDPNLINVAVSRAQKEFILVTDKYLFSKKGNNIKDLIGYIEYNILDNEIIQGKIVGIFDLLYTDFSKKLVYFKNKIINRSKFESENIMEALIKEEILSLTKYSSLNYMIQYRLKDLFYNSQNFTEEELKFINTVSSLDFIIFSKFNKEPILAIEVDGFAYHENNLEQQKRDKLKTSILEKKGLPLLRLETNGSNEKNKIIKILDQILEKN